MNERFNISRYLIAMSTSCTIMTIAMEPEQQIGRLLTPTEHLAIDMLKNTPPEHIPNLILKRFPQQVRNAVFEKFMPGYSRCKQAAKLNDSLLLIGHYVEAEARDHERKFSFTAPTPSDIPAACSWISRIDNNAWKPCKRTPVEKHIDGSGF